MSASFRVTEEDPKCPTIPQSVYKDAVAHHSAFS